MPLSVLAQDTGAEPSDRRERAEREFEFGYRAYHQEANLAEARRRLENSIKADSTYYRALYGLGKVYYALGLNDRALETWRKGLLASSYIRKWFRRELDAHQLRYSSSRFEFQQQWDYLGLIDCAVAGRMRNVNPSALAFLPDGKIRASSLSMNRIVEYSGQGTAEKLWTGFSGPADIVYHSDLGLLVAEYDGDKISRITHEGEKKEFAVEGVRTPKDIIVFKGKIYVFNDAPGELVRLSQAGETIAVLWEETPLNRISDVAVDSGGRFWLLDERSNSFHILESHGEPVEEIEIDPRLGIKKFWFHKGHLLAAAQSGLIIFNPRSGESQPLYQDGDIISGEDISDLAFHADRMLVSLFEESSLLIYRLTGRPEPDILVQDRRTKFENYPVVSMNLIITDPLKSGRYKQLSDRSLGITVENMTALPSLLRPSQDVYNAGWIIIVDNRFDSEQTWREQQLFLEKLITDAPEKSHGTIWQIDGEVVVHPYSSSRTSLRNALQTIFPSTRPVSEGDTRVAYYLEQALNNSFARRGPTGIILVSQNLPDSGTEILRLARRSRNNFVPLIIINPSIDPLPPEYPLNREGEAVYINYDNMRTDVAWNFYNDMLAHHYTAIFRSPIIRLQSGEWDTYEFVFHYMNRKYRFECGYLLP
jgi:tetratricopeptide (TPR) repeat protein